MAKPHEAYDWDLDFFYNRDLSPKALDALSGHVEEAVSKKEPPFFPAGTEPAATPAESAPAVSEPSERPEEISQETFDALLKNYMERAEAKKAPVKPEPVEPEPHEAYDWDLDPIYEQIDQREENTQQLENLGLRRRQMAKVIESFLYWQVGTQKAKLMAGSGIDLLSGALADRAKKRREEEQIKYPDLPAGWTPVEHYDPLVQFGERMRKSAEEKLKILPKAMPGDWWENLKDPDTRRTQLTYMLMSNVQPTILIGASAAMAGAFTGPGGALTTAAGGTWLLEAGSSYKELTEMGVSKEEARATASIVGTINTALELVPLGRIATKVPGIRKTIGLEVQKELIRNNKARRVLTEMLKQGTLEGATEVLQEIVQNAGKRVYDENQDLLAGTDQAAFIGGILGALMGGGFAMVETEAPLVGPVHPGEFEGEIPPWEKYLREKIGAEAPPGLPQVNIEPGTNRPSILRGDTPEERSESLKGQATDQVKEFDDEIGGVNIPIDYEITPRYRESIKDLLDRESLLLSDRVLDLEYPMGFEQPTMGRIEPAITEMGVRGVVEPEDIAAARAMMPRPGVAEVTPEEIEARPPEGLIAREITPEEIEIRTPEQLARGIYVEEVEPELEPTAIPERIGLEEVAPEEIEIGEAERVAIEQRRAELEARPVEEEIEITPPKERPMEVKRLEYPVEKITIKPPKEIPRPEVEEIEPEEIEVEEVEKPREEAPPPAVPKREEEIPTRPPEEPTEPVERPEEIKLPAPTPLPEAELPESVPERVQELKGEKLNYAAFKDSIMGNVMGAALAKGRPAEKAFLNEISNLRDAYPEHYKKWQTEQAIEAPEFEPEAFEPPEVSLEPEPAPPTIPPEEEELPFDIEETPEEELELEEEELEIDIAPEPAVPEEIPEEEEELVPFIDLLTDEAKKEGIDLPKDQMRDLMKRFIEERRKEKFPPTPPEAPPEPKPPVPEEVTEEEELIPFIDLVQEEAEKELGIDIPKDRMLDAMKGVIEDIRKEQLPKPVPEEEELVPFIDLLQEEAKKELGVDIPKDKMREAMQQVIEDIRREQPPRPTTPPEAPTEPTPEAPPDSDLAAAKALSVNEIMDELKRNRTVFGPLRIDIQAPRPGGQYMAFINSDDPFVATTARGFSGEGRTAFIEGQLPIKIAEVLRGIKDPTVPAADFPTSFSQEFDRIDKATGSENYVSLVDLRKALPQFDRETFDKGLYQLRVDGTFDLSAEEGRYGITPEQREAGIMEGDTLLLYASRIKPRKPPPPTPPEAPTEPTPPVPTPEPAPTPAPEAKGKPLKLIMMPAEEFIDETGKTGTIQESAEAALNRIDTKIKRLYALRDCIRAGR